MMKQDKTAILIKKIALEFDKLANAYLEQYDLTTSQYKVIKYVYSESENGVRIVDLEKYYSMTHPTAIGIVQNLEKKGLVTYAPNPNDARSRFIIPTEKAIEARSRLEGLGDSMDAELTKNLTEKEKTQLVSLLCKLINIPQD